MGFEKTYRKRKVWGSHAKRTGLNKRILLELERQNKRIRKLEEIAFPMPEKKVMVKKAKKRKLAKWGRNKPR